MKKIILVAILATTTLPATAFAGASTVKCSASSDGKVTCSYSYTW